MTRDDLLAALTHDNVQAFLRVIRAGESSNDDSAYTEMFGGEHFAAPPWEHPHRAVDASGISSTAAGAYQFLAKTWDALVAQYGFADFSPPNQDQGAVALIASRGALDDVIAGGLEDAIAKTNKEWASLPGSPYGQPTRTLAQAREVFAAYGGRAVATTPVEPSLDTPAEPVDVAPAPLQPQGVKPMGILAAILPSLLQAAPDLIRLFGSSGGAMTERNAAVAQKVADVAVQVTGAVNEQAAADKIAADPKLAQAFRDAVAQNFDQWLGMMTKFAQIEEDSRAKAKEFVTAYDRNPVFFKFTFIELLSLIFVTISSVGGGWVLYADFPAEIKGAVVTLMLIGGYTGVKEFWLGSSMGSRSKDAAGAGR